MSCVKASIHVVLEYEATVCLSLCHSFVRVYLSLRSGIRIIEPLIKYLPQGFGSGHTIANRRYNNQHAYYKSIAVHT